MKSNIFATLFILLLTSQAYGQASSSLFAKAIDSLEASRIDNEIMITDSTNPKVVVLFAKGSRESLSLLSMSHGKVRTEWYLAKLPDFMSVIAPADLRVVTTDDGPVILLHGCARHLCGGEGVAGALTYVVNKHQIYTLFANWSVSTKTAKFVYSPEDSTPGFEVQKKLLDSMLRDENYNP
jgi:hypothetical protein